MKTRYVGGSRPGVELRFPTRTIVAVHGEPFECTEEEAATLGDDFQTETETDSKTKSTKGK